MERLQKVMAHAGIASRRKCEEIILNNRVTVNGKVVNTLGYKVNNNDKIEVDGVPITKENLVYYAFYKPKGVISAVSDKTDRKVVTDFFDDISKRIYPIGRLDYDTSGLLLLTNDGELSQRLTHPKHQIPKVYVAKVKGIANKHNLKPIVYGMKLDDFKTAPARYEILSTNETKQTSVVSLTICEGKYHQVKRMFEHCKLPVQKLKRESFGNIDLTGLRPGEYRKLTPKEIKQLKQL